MKFEVVGVTVEFETKPDLFSPKGLDRGTCLLLEVLTEQNYDSLLDWGCGWGAIALFAAKFNPSAGVVAIDSDIAAVATSTVNAKLNNLSNLTVLASHGFDQLPPQQKFDMICVNPPTHRGREVVEQMIEQAHSRLAPGGRILLVVEARIAPWIKRQLGQVFGSYEIVRRGPKNVVLLARNEANHV